MRGRPRCSPSVAVDTRSVDCRYEERLVSFIDPPLFFPEQERTVAVLLRCTATKLAIGVNQRAQPTSRAGCTEAITSRFSSAPEWCQHMPVRLCLAPRQIARSLDRSRVPRFVHHA